VFTAVFLLWNYREWPQAPYTSESDQRSRLLEDRVEVLNKRVSDVELLVLILLGASGLYSIVFIGSSYLSSMRFAREADRSIAEIQDQIGLAMGDLRELKEEVKRAVREQPKQSQGDLEAPMAAELAGLYRSFAAICASTDPARAISSLRRASALAPSSEIHYELACCYAAAHDFEHAVQELATAFQHQSRALDERLANDIEEGGRLYELASTPPFDKAVNDVLLNVVL
jgi:tetratricopeptide (TPR) repeat protein